MKEKISLIVYVKTIVDKVHNTQFEKYLCKYGDKTFDLNFSHVAKEDMNRLMLVNKMHFPVILAIDPQDYFVKKKEYKTKDGQDKQKAVMVVTKFGAIAQHEFEDRPLDEILAEIYCTEMTEKSK